MQISSTPTINTDTSALLLKQINSGFAKLDTNELSLSPTSLGSSNETVKSTAEKSIGKNDNVKVTRSSNNDAQTGSKNRLITSRDYSNCLICGWNFPHSFKGEEKNSHVYRCMENKSDKDRKFWLKCEGNVKQYIHGFEEYLRELGGNRAKNFKSNEAGDLKDSSQSVSTTTQAHRPKKSRSRKEGKGQKSDDFANFEPVMNKKIKIEGDLPQTLPEPYKKKWTNILMLPVVRTLVFDPSKEFKGNPRK